MRFVFARTWRVVRFRSRRPAIWRFALCLTTAVAIANITTLPPSVDPAEDFVKGLQERGLHDLALEYLDELKSSPLADESVRKQIPYLRGGALIEKSRQA